MKQTLRWLCICLALCMLVGVLAACGAPATDKPDGGKDGETKDQTESKGVETEGETKPVYLDSLPETLNFGGEEIRFLPVTNRHGMSVYVNVEDSTGDIVEDAIIERNAELQERLGVVIECLPPAGYLELTGRVANAVDSGSDDYDVVIGYCSADIGMAQQGFLINMNNLNYVNFKAPYWGQEYMKAMTYKGTTFWATGDINLTYTSFSYAFLVNSKRWKDLYPDENIYKIVNDREWTIETLTEFAEGATAELDGNDKLDKEDRWGFAMQDGHYEMAMAMACGIEYSQVDQNGDVHITLESEETETIYEILHELFFEAENATLMMDLHEYDDGARKMFTEDRLLFFNMTIVVLENSEVRNMKSDYMVIPMPMMDDAQDDYYNMLQDGVAIYAVPTTASAAKYDAIGATLEAMASMSVQQVLPVYYDNALKFKYSRDEESGKMIDLIHDTVRADFAFVWGKNINEITWFMYHNMKKGSTSLAAAFASNRDAWTTSLEKLTEALDEYADYGA